MNVWQKKRRLTLVALFCGAVHYVACRLPNDDYHVVKLPYALLGVSMMDHGCRGADEVEELGRRVIGPGRLRISSPTWGKVTQTQNPTPTERERQRGLLSFPSSRVGSCRRKKTVGKEAGGHSFLQALLQSRLSTSLRYAPLSSSFTATENTQIIVCFHRLSLKVVVYWVSQGNKWCDFCKIYIANNPQSIRTHELGQRHKDNVANRIAAIRKENASKEKEQKEAMRVMQQIEARAMRSYQKDLASFKETQNSKAGASNACDEIPETAKPASGDGWDFDSASGYYYNQASGYYYDQNSGLYYSDAIGIFVLLVLSFIYFGKPGKWVKQEEAFASSQVSAADSQNHSEPKSSRPRDQPLAAPKPIIEGKDVVKLQSGPAPGLVLSVSQHPLRPTKRAPSSISVNKRKRDDGKPKVVSKEEAAALREREAAKKRVEEREKSLLVKLAIQFVYSFCAGLKYCTAASFLYHLSQMAFSEIEMLRRALPRTTLGQRMPEMFRETKDGLKGKRQMSLEDHLLQGSKSNPDPQKFQTSEYRGTQKEDQRPKKPKKRDAKGLLFLKQESFGMSPKQMCLSSCSNPLINEDHSRKFSPCGFVIESVSDVLERNWSKVASESYMKFTFGNAANALLGGPRTFKKKRRRFALPKLYVKEMNKARSAKGSEYSQKTNFCPAARQRSPKSSTVVRDDAGQH
ncbi:hypothetical protein ACLOJK_013610 [Asimina triloba]